MGVDERPAPVEEAERALASMTVSDIQDHAFWETQPVGQLKPELDRPGPEGPIDDPMTIADVKQEEYSLPESFEWSSCDMADPKTNEEVYELLDKNYVEDDDAMFRFQYSKEFLKWALQPPGYHVDWHLGVRVKGTGKLVAFITGVPAHMVVKGKEIDMAEINFLCIHKKLRSKRLGAHAHPRDHPSRQPSRRVAGGVHRGVVLPKPIGTARYWHRSLNIKKLVEIGFTHLHPRTTMSRSIKLFKLEPKPSIPASSHARRGRARGDHSGERVPSKVRRCAQVRRGGGEASPVDARWRGVFFRGGGPRVPRCGDGFRLLLLASVDGDSKQGRTRHAARGVQLLQRPGQARHEAADGGRAHSRQAARFRRVQRVGSHGQRAGVQGSEVRHRGREPEVLPVQLAAFGDARPGDIGLVLT